MELERAFADLQNSKEMTSLDESLRLLKRKPDQMLPIPQLTVSEGIKGAQISWVALPDQRINFYEANISTFSNFSVFTTITTFGNDIIVEGLSSSKYVRVRGVRRDGTSTPYSDVATITGEQFEIRAHTAEGFYTKLEGAVQHTLLGGTGTTLDFTPATSNGTSMVWGFLTAYADPAIAMFGDGKIQTSVWIDTVDPNGSTIDSTEYARISLGEHYNSQNIGPFPVNHPPVGNRLVIRLLAWDLTTKENGTPRTQDSTVVEWCHLNVLEIGVE
jgi:hypothetical protein